MSSNFFLSYKQLASFFWFFIASDVLLSNIISPRIATGVQMSILFGLSFIAVSYKMIKSHTLKVSFWKTEPLYNNLYLYLLVSVISIFNGESSELFVDLAYFSLTIYALILINCFRAELNQQEFLDSFSFLARGLSLVLLFSILFINTSAAGGRLSAETLHANMIGEYATIVIVYFLTRFLFRDSLTKLDILSLTIAVIALLRAFSKTSLLIVAILSPLIFIISFGERRIIHKRTVIALIFLLLALNPIITLLTENIVFYLTEGTSASTLSGRTLIWARAFELIPEHPIIGHGWRSTNDVLGYFFESFELSHCHNEYINALFETGVLGLLLLLIFQIRVIIKLLLSYRLNRDSNTLLFLFLIAIFLLRSYTELSFSHGGMELYVLYAAAVFLSYKGDENESINSHPLI